MRFLKNKKGVELTMQTIIIAVLVIIVLIVLVLIFSKSARNFFLGTSSCYAKGGDCMDKCSDGWTNYFAGNPECESNTGARGNLCCIKETDILGTEENPYS